MTRVAILERAQEMYVDRELVHGDERLSAVLEDLGYTTGAGYQIWSNQAEFRQDLQVFVAERLQAVDLDGLADTVDGSQDLAQAIDQLSIRLLDRVCAWGDYFLSLRFYGMDADRPEEVTAAMVGTADRFIESLEAMLSEVVARLGRRFRPEADSRVVAQAVAALLQGLALQQRVDRRAAGSRNRSAASLGLVALLDAATEPAS
jgi:hypothetical protein